MLAYLCGPIEFAADGGKMWRRKLTPFLHNELGLNSVTASTIPPKMRKKA